MKRLMRHLLVTSIAAWFATTASFSAPRCVVIKNGASATISGIVMDNSPGNNGGSYLLVKLDNPCDAKFAEIAVLTKEKLADCGKDERITVTGKVAVGDQDYGEAALLSPSKPPICHAS